MRTFLTTTALLIAAPAATQTAPAPAELLDGLGRLGAVIHQLDRAAWVATDAMTAAVPRASLTGPGGWVVERASGGDLTVTFFRGEGEAARTAFHATVRDGKVVESRVVTIPAPLTPAQARLAAARDTAAAEAVRRRWRPCTAAPFNTVVVPGGAPDAPILVYLLSAQLQADSVPLGGHFRVVIDLDGKPVNARPYSKSCLNMTLPKLPAGAKPTGLFVSHLLDPIPTELHVFTSYGAGLPLFVGTPDRRVWSVTGSRITMSTMKPPAPPPAN